MRRNVRALIASLEATLTMVSPPLFCGDAAAQLPCAYEADIIFPPACGTSPGRAAGWGISEQGDIAGDFGCPGGTDDAFISWNAEELTPVVGLPAGTYNSVAIDIEDGMYAGDFFAGSSGRQGFFFDGRNMHIIPPLAGGTTVEVYGMNGAATVIGAWGHLAQEPFVFPRAFLWRDGVLHDISVDLLPYSRALDVNDVGAITGYMGETAFPSNAHAFIWENGVVTDLGLMPGSIGTEGYGINNMRQVCGVAWFLADNPQGFVRRGFFWDKDVFTDLGVLPGMDEMFPKRISEDGTVVGFASRIIFGGGRGFVWKAGVLKDVRPMIITPGLNGSTTRDVSVSTQIAGAGIYLFAGEEYTDLVAVRLRPVARLPGDTNCNRTVDIDDLLTVIAHWGASGVDADVNGSGLVDIHDVMLVIVNWSQ